MFLALIIWPWTTNHMCFPWRGAPVLHTALPCVCRSSVEMKLHGLSPHRLYHVCYYTSLAHILAVMLMRLYKNSFLYQKETQYHSKFPDLMAVTFFFQNISLAWEYGPFFSCNHIIEHDDSPHISAGIILVSNYFQNRNRVTLNNRTCKNLQDLM